MTQQIDYNTQIKNLPSDGWVTSSYSWTTSGTHTFIITGDVSSDYNYQPGTKIRATGASGTVYGVIEQINYSTPYTTVTLIDNDDYALYGSITVPYTSHTQMPDGWPEWFNYTPSITAGGSMTISNEVINNALWKVDGQTMSIHVNFNCDLGGTANSNIFASYPGNAIPVSATAFVCGARDASSGLIPVGTGVFLTSLGITMRKADVSNWTLSTSRAAFGDGSFQWTV